MQVRQQRCERAVEFGEQAILETMKIIAVGVPATTTFAEGIQFHVPFPEDGDEGDRGFDQPPRHQHGGGIDSPAIPFQRCVRFETQIERRLGFGRTEQREGFVLLLGVVPTGKIGFEILATHIEGGEQFTTGSQAIGRDFPLQFERWGGEFHRLFA